MENDKYSHRYNQMDMRAVTHQPISAPGGYSHQQQQMHGYANPPAYHHYQQPATAPIMNHPMQNPMLIQQQPSFQPSMRMQSHHSTVTYQDSKDRKRPWSTDLCSCCADIGTCFQVMLCPLCTVMHISHRTDEGCWMPLCVPMSLMALRIKMRTHQDIEGSIAKDCCAVACCTMCSICQLKREQDCIAQARVATQIKRGH